MIRLCRVVVSNFLKENRESVLFGGVPLRQAVNFENDADGKGTVEYATMDEYCEKCVLPMDVLPIGAFVNVSILPYCFKCNMRILSVNRIGHYIFVNNPQLEEFIGNAFTTISLLLSGGHYSLIYMKHEVEEMSVSELNQMHTYLRNRESLLKNIDIFPTYINASTTKHASTTIETQEVQFTLIDSLKN